MSTRTKRQRQGWGRWTTLTLIAALALPGCVDRDDDDDSALGYAACDSYCLRMMEPLRAWIEDEGCNLDASQEVAWIDVYGTNCALVAAEYEAICGAAPETPSCRTCVLWFEDALRLHDTLEVVTTCYMHYDDYPDEYDQTQCERACRSAGLEF
ncbi:MAG: hypothetical protein QGH45_05545 [Myxococcota bacterium]|jgi:hypothetical protein|nr:hypothetical protein [Myxococcota bacterium]